MGSETKRVAVIDGNSLMHRAYHAVPPTMNAPDGTPTNAVFGFLSMLLKFIEEASPDAVVCAFDAGKPTFRIEALEQYKAQRPHMDQELKVQFPIIEELLTSMKIPVVKNPGWEGDDILGTVAAMDENLGYKTLLVTGDKDAYQLVTDLTHVVTTKKGITDVAIYGPDQVYERYGVTPTQFIDFLGLKGDSADNIPGVPGIGDKTAAKLIQAYGSIDGIYEHIDELKGKQKENLENFREQAYVSRTVATIVTDAPIEVDVESASFPAYDADDVTASFGKYGLNSHLAKVLKLKGLGGSTIVLKTLDLPMVEPLTGDEARDAFKRALADKSLLGVEFLHPTQESLFAEPLCLYIASGSETVLCFKEDEARDAFVRIVEDGVPFCCLDAKRTLQEVFPRDSSEAASLNEGQILGARYFDIALAAYLLDSSQKSLTYEALCDKYMGSGLPACEAEYEEAAQHALVAPMIAGKLRTLLDSDGCLECYERIDLPLVGILAIMERNGAALDAGAMAKLGASVSQDLNVLREDIMAMAGEEFNLNSPKQLGHILFEVLGLPHGKKTKSGYSTDAAVLTKLAEDHELPAKVLRYRELEKLRSTYIEALPRIAQGYGDGLVHTSFNQTVTATGRLSSSDPNLQNIPVRTDLGRSIRDCFVPLAGHDYYVSADYSQIELRMLAHLSGDSALIDSFCSGEDFHAMTASRVFNVPFDEVTDLMRRRAKAVNFGIVYGQQAFGLSQSLGIPYREAQSMIDRYFATHTQVRGYLNEVVEKAKRDGYATTLFDRKRHIPELSSGDPNKRSFGERTAMNHPMQGSAADIIKMSMLEVQRRLIEGGFSSRMLLQVHDELDFSVPADELEPLMKMVDEVMSNIVQLKVPLVVDVGYGRNWSEAH